MIRLRVFCHGIPCGILEKMPLDGTYCFAYDEHYAGSPISLTMPVQEKSFFYTDFPPFFEGLLPEGLVLEEFLSHHKIDAENYLSQLAAMGQNLTGIVTVQQMKESV